MIVTVETYVRFAQFDQGDPLLHAARGELALRHRACGGGAIRVRPRPYRRSLLGAWRPRKDLVDGPRLRLVCGRCGARSTGFTHEQLSGALRRFLHGPDRGTAPAQVLEPDVRFVPRVWPPLRRGPLDRRQPGEPRPADPPGVGRRRAGRDRRADAGAPDPRSPSGPTEG